MADTVFVLNGPNLNLLGLREPEIYGPTRSTILPTARRSRPRTRAGESTCASPTMKAIWSTGFTRRSARGAKAVLLNAGGFTHTSVAIHDAIKAVERAGDRGASLQPARARKLPPCELRRPGREGDGRGFRRNVLSARAGRGREALTGSGRETAQIRFKIRRTERVEFMTDTPEGANGAAMQVDAGLVRQLAELLDATRLTEIEVQDGDRRIRVARTVSMAAAPADADAPRRLCRRAGSGRSAAPPPLRSPPRPADHPGTVKSPMVGTAYLAAEPGRRAVRRGRQAGRRRRHAADRRGDEGDEPDPRAQGRQGRRRSWSRTASRSSSTSRSSSSSKPPWPIQKVLIANRGEIALRIHRACHEMGIQTVAVHSTADADAMHVRLADQAVCIGPPAASESYLNIPNIICGGRDLGRRRDPPGLRLPQRERPLRRDRRSARPDLHRAQARAYPHHGRQDRGEATAAQARPAAGAGLGRPADRHRRGQARRGRDRLSGADQGGLGRRRARHEGRARPRTSSKR